MFNLLQDICLNSTQSTLEEKKAGQMDLEQSGRGQKQVLIANYLPIVGLYLFLQAFHNQRASDVSLVAGAARPPLVLSSQPPDATSELDLGEITCPPMRHGFEVSTDSRNR